MCRDQAAVPVLGRNIENVAVLVHHETLHMTADNIKLLRFKWTTSRARDTYGYNICSLYVDGVKVASCNGGGYDMQGTVLAEYLVEVEQPALQAIKHRAHMRYLPVTGDDYRLEENAEEKDTLYGMTDNEKTGRVQIYGACGESAVKKIAEAAGISLTTARVDKDEWGYFYTPSDEKGGDEA